MRAKRETTTGWMAGVIALAWVLPADANPFRDHPVFSKLTGDWTAEGNLAGPDGQEAKLTETWTGSIEADGSLLIEGEREFNDEKQAFTWRYTWNAAAELFECEYEQPGMEEPLRLQVTVADTVRTVELKAQLGDSGGEIAIVKKLAEDGKSIESEVKLVDASGQTNLGGTIQHTRKE